MSDSNENYEEISHKTSSNIFVNLDLSRIFKGRGDGKIYCLCQFFYSFTTKIPWKKAS